ncbi:MAG: CPBP family intramembrane metalloprotease, partial [Lachnospiraceae bacterium]|nr:CPBP family intramembrane metalloprotease [Lachnospiraceae bacterium]
RGYMMPKMIKLWGVGKAVVIGGIIWGVWHWPLTYVGHNFGMEYFGYPFTGFAAMCIMCIFMGIILTYVTCKSGSIWPAAILHAINNASPSVLQYFINNDKVSGWRSDSVVSFLIGILPMMAIAVYILIRWLKAFAE